MDESSNRALRGHLAAARTHLSHARAIEAIGIHDIAAREAYQAAFHAAEAALIARTGRRAKTHAGLRTALAKLALDSDEINPEWAKFLARAYELKSIADYGIRTDAISAEDAQFATDGAARLLDEVMRLFG